MTLEEHLTKITGAKDIQIAALLSQVDSLRDQMTKLVQASQPTTGGTAIDSAVKANGKAEPIPAPPT